MCSTCTAPCYTCVTSTSNCTGCAVGSHRTLTTNTCPCDVGYYENSGTCTICPVPCSACNTAIFCTSCTPTHMNPVSGTCTCDPGYVYVGGVCTSCTIPCATCITSST